MEEYAPTQVYKNLVKMLGYRGVRLSAEPLTEDAIVEKLNHYEFITIVGNRPAEDPRGAAEVITIMIAPKSKYSNKTADFKKILAGLPKRTKADKVGLDVIIVSELTLTTHIKKQMNNYLNANPFTHLEDHGYNIFLIEVPKHECVPEHSIPAEGEIEKFCRQHYVSIVNFPKIMQSDPMAVWLGLKPGMVVKINRISETSGIAIAYRYCMRG